MGLLALAGCSLFDLWAGDPAVSLPDSGSWVVLPMRAFVSRENIRVDGLQLCTKMRCGYDAAIERFTVTGPDALAIERSLSEPRRLAALLAKSDPKTKTPPPKVSVDGFASGDWRGVQLAMTGGKKSHHFNAYAVGQRQEGGASFIVVIAGEPRIARKLIDEATQ
ncbi:hypothetical protein C5L14_14240 [Labrys okinawensis]|uniref:Uncharacterized protein n=2 Tax=Xanthobacteraceae TaxID=335928 RepID=A0A2S9QAX2_9HYPH|nr:hypothetical protein C5L14_14240 [Labrys okinawensis]